METPVTPEPQNPSTPSTPTENSNPPVTNSPPTPDYEALYKAQSQMLEGALGRVQALESEVVSRTQQSSQPASQDPYVDIPDDNDAYISNMKGNTIKIVETALQRTIQPLIQGMQQFQNRDVYSELEAQELNTNPQSRQLWPILGPIVKQILVNNPVNPNTFSQAVSLAYGYAVRNGLFNQLAGAGGQPNQNPSKPNNVSNNSSTPPYIPPSAPPVVVPNDGVKYQRSLNDLDETQRTIYLQQRSKRPNLTVDAFLESISYGQRHSYTIKPKAKG